MRMQQEGMDQEENDDDDDQELNEEESRFAYILE